MPTYNIQKLNYGANIIDPSISVKRKLSALDPDAMTIDALVYFEITDVSGNVNVLGHTLKDLPIVNLDFLAPEILAIVMTRLSTPEYLVP